MRHYKKGRKLGTSKAHTKAMKRSLVTALFENDRIKTIEARAKEIRPDVDKIITWAKKGDLHSRRLAIAALGGNKELVREIFEKVEKGMFKDRNGGYTRILKLGYRKGDNAPIVIIELVSEPVSKKAKASVESAKAKPAAKATAKKATKKAEEAENASADEETKATDENPDEIIVEGEEVVDAEDTKSEEAESEASAETEAEEAKEADAEAEDVKEEADDADKKDSE